MFISNSDGYGELRRGHYACAVDMLRLVGMDVNHNCLGYCTFGSYTLSMIPRKLFQGAVSIMYKPHFVPS